MAIDPFVEEPAWQSYGAHRARFEPPDVLVMQTMGDVGIEEIRQFLGDLVKWPRPERGFFYISDVSQMGHQTGQVAGEMRKLPPNIFRATAVVGAKFHQRVAADLLRRVMVRLNLPGYAADAQFFATEAEARVWIDSLRAQG